MNAGTRTLGGGILCRVEFLQDERVIQSSWAQYSRGWLTGISGKLSLTDHRLIFCPVRYPLFRIRPFVCDLSEIERVDRVRWRGWDWLLHRMTPGAIRLLVDGKKHFFFLGFKKNKAWLQELAERTGLTPTDEG